MSEKDLTDEDRQHIARLQTLREMGTHNMFMELNDGLHAYYDAEEAQATYEWVTENFEYFQSAEWRDVDPAGGSDDD